MFYNSQLAYKQAIKSIPGGVNSPVRAFRSVDSTPIFFKSGNGSKMIDIDDNEYIAVSYTHLTLPTTYEV